MSEKRAPGPDFRFARALDDNGEVGGEGGYEWEDGGKQSGFGWRLRVNFFIEDVVKEDFESVVEVGEVLVVVGEMECGR